MRHLDKYFTSFVQHFVHTIQQSGIEVTAGFIVGFDNDPPNIFQRQVDFIQRSGIITAINPELRETGAIANQSPYSEGWVMIVKPDNLRQDIKNLMINHETSDFMSEQVELLYQEIEAVAGPMATDGGFLGNDIYGNMPQFDWNRLTEVFLKT